MGYGAITEYLDGIRDGRFTVNSLTRRAYERLTEDMDSGVYLYDGKKANKAIRFIETFCQHSKGTRGHIRLELWQKALITAIFGTVDSDGARHYREVFVVIARKNGKSTLAAAIATYMAYADGEMGAEIFFTAPKLEQADACYSAFTQMVTREPELSALAKKRRTDIYLKDNNTTAKKLAFDKDKSDSLNIQLAVCDELGAWNPTGGNRFYQVLRSSLGARRQPLILSITTANYVNDGPYDRTYKRVEKWLNRASDETRLFGVIYAIEDPLRWNDIEELKKASPNMGVSVKEDFFKEQAAAAKEDPDALVEFMIKYCNIKQNDSHAWLRTEDVDACCSEVAITPETLRGSYAVGGIDLSRTTDLTAACMVVEKNGNLYVMEHFWLPSERIDKLAERDHMPYRVYISRGLMDPSGEQYVDYRDVFRWFETLRTEYEIIPLVVGYDRYMALYLINDMKDAGYQTDWVFQGPNLTPVIREAEGLIRSGVVHIGNNDILRAHLLNTRLKHVSGERVQIEKKHDADHVDGADALLDALTVRQKWYEKLGAYLKNEEM